MEETEIYEIIKKNNIRDRIFSCSLKVKFSLKQAKRKAKQYGQYYYKCNHCGYYHLTKQPTYESVLDTDELMHEYQDFEADYAEQQAEWYQDNIWQIYIYILV